MRWAHGHRPASVQNFDMQIDGSFAGLAYATGEMVYSADVSTDERFAPHANADRPYASLACVPLRCGTDIVGVLSALSTRANSFTESDLQFMTVIAAIIDTVLAAENDARRFNDQLEKRNEHIRTLTEQVRAMRARLEELGES